MSSINHPNVHILQLGERTLYLIGTAHVSKESTELVKAVIQEIKPESVAVELCAPRLESITKKDRWKNLDLFTLIKEGKSQLLMAQLALAGFQKKIGQKLEVEPGAEMLAAVAEASLINAKLELVDREVKITLKRTWAKLGVWQALQVIVALVSAMFNDQEVSKEEIERLKTSDALDEALKEFSKKFPDVRRTLIDERDTYMAQKLLQIEAKTIVAVIGAGHIPGIKNEINKTIDIKTLETIPEPSLTRKLLPWLLPLIIVLTIAYGFYFIDFQTGIDAMLIWIVFTSLSAGLGALIALPHPLTVLAAALSAPFTALHPFLASGWAAGLAEAFLRKPRVKDLETIVSDLSLKGFYSNRALKVLLVIITTNLIGSLGTIISIERVFNLFNK